METTWLISPGDTLRLTSLLNRNSSFDCTVVAFPWPTMRLHTECDLAVPTPVKVESPECMFLGETCSLVGKGSGFLLSVLVDQVLTGLTDLERLWTRRAVAGDAVVGPFYRMPTKDLGVARK